MFNSKHALLLSFHIDRGVTYLSPMSLSTSSYIIIDNSYHMLYIYHIYWIDLDMHISKFLA